MSIEQTLADNTAALNRVAAALEAQNAGTAAPAQTATPVPPAETTPAPAEVPAAPAQPDIPAVPATAPAAATTVEMTVEELNQALVAEAGRLGGPDRVFAMMRETYGVASVNELQPDQYANVVASAKALV